MKQDLIVHYKHSPEGRIPESAALLTERLKLLASHKTGVYQSPEHAVRLPSDPSIMLDVLHQVEQSWNTQLAYVIVVGIGGSNLGAKAVYDALLGGAFTKERKASLIFLDTVTASTLTAIEDLLDTKIHYPEEIIINLISKSGGTTESIANFEIIYAMLVKRFSKTNGEQRVRSRIVVTTDHDSKLWKHATKEEIALLSLPKEIGGRFSGFSAVGLFPLALAGIDIKELLAGARDVTASFFTKENHALRFAEDVYRAEKHGASILNFFFFNPELESLGKWARQLYGESLGKQFDKTGKEVRAGITPIVSIGSVDLHSMAQLYLGGPRDKMTLFIYVPERSRMKVPQHGLFLNLVPAVSEKSPDSIMQAIYGGTIAAYHTHRLPYCEAFLPAVSPYALGMFLQWHMLAVMYLGEMWHLNTFDQPNVEDYKKVTKQILENSK
jgi:glucose-6-phosphate isomerase